MKLGENNHIIRQLFSPSFTRIGQKLWIFHYWPIFEYVRFLLTQTLGMIFVPSKSKANKYDYLFQLKFAMELEVKNMSTNVAHHKTSVISTKVIVMNMIIVLVT